MAFVYIKTEFERKISDAIRSTLDGDFYDSWDEPEIEHPSDISLIKKCKLHYSEHGAEDEKDVNFGTYFRQISEEVSITGYENASRELLDVLLSGVINDPGLIQSEYFDVTGTYTSLAVSGGKFFIDQIYLQDDSDIVKIPEEIYDMQGTKYSLDDEIVEETLSKLIRLGFDYLKKIGIINYMVKKYPGHEDDV